MVDFGDKVCSLDGQELGVVVDIGEDGDGNKIVEVGSPIVTRNLILPLSQIRRVVDSHVLMMAQLRGNFS